MESAITAGTPGATLDTPVWAPFTNSSLLSYLPSFTTAKQAGDAGTGSTSTAVGAIFVLNTINSATLGYESAAALSSGNGAGAGAYGGQIAITANNTATISATNTSTTTASSGTAGPTATSPGTGLAVNAIIATSNILGQTQAYADGGSLTADGTAGDVDIAADSNATIDAENTASTDAKTTSVGVVLAFNTIGIKQPVAGFLENTVDALFGTDLAGEQPDQVYAYISDATTDASNGVDVNAMETSTITAKINNAETGLFSSGTSVAATVTLNRVATDVEAWVTGGSVTATSGDIDIAGTDQSTITSTVLTPVVKLSANFSSSSGGGSSSSNATTIGVSIARNIIDNTLSASAGTAAGGTTLIADDGNISVTANQLASISATSASAAISVALNTSGSSGSFAGGGAVAINTITGSVNANSLNSTLTATTGGANTGAITVSSTYGGSITSLVAALAAAVTVGDGASDAIAIGAAVSVNLIGWRGTVADETEDSSDPIVLASTVNGGSLTAGGLVKVASTSTSTISATTAAVAVAIGVSTGSGSSSGGKESTGGDSPTDADEEGEGSTTDASGDTTATDEGQADGTTVDEGADNAGGAETNEGETSGAAAGDSGNTASQESGASQGSATSDLSGIGSGGGLLVGAGGVVSAATAGSSAPAATYTTTATSGTDVQTLNNGDTVQLATGYDAATYSVGTGTTNTDSTVSAGDVVDDSGTLYRYVGSTPLTGVDFEVGATPPNFDTSSWISGRRHGRARLQIYRAGRHADRLEQSGLHQREPVDRHHRRRQLGGRRNDVFVLERGARVARRRSDSAQRRVGRHVADVHVGRRHRSVWDEQSLRARDADERDVGPRRRQWQRRGRRQRQRRRAIGRRELHRGRRLHRKQDRVVDYGGDRKHRVHSRGERGLGRRQGRGGGHRANHLARRRGGGLGQFLRQRQERHRHHRHRHCAQHDPGFRHREYPGRRDDHRARRSDHGFGDAERRHSGHIGRRVARNQRERPERRVRRGRRLARRQSDRNRHLGDSVQHRHRPVRRRRRSARRHGDG